MPSPFVARPVQEPEVFPLVAWHNHPVYQGFYVLRNGDTWVDAGSPLGHLGQFDLRSFPTDQWIALQDKQGAPLPVEIYIQRFGKVLGRWLGMDEGTPGPA